jgi:hypothetical protein
VVFEQINATSQVAIRPGRHWTQEYARVLWHLIRLPVLALLVILRPIVTLLCGGMALLGVLTTIFFVVVHAPHFPAWTMLFLSLGLLFGLIVYEGAIRVLSA